MNEFCGICGVELTEDFDSDPDGTLNSQCAKCVTEQEIDFYVPFFLLLTLKSDRGFIS